MATTAWTGKSGKWTDATWTDGVPDASLDAIADGTSLSPITINFDTPSGAAHSLTMADATLAVAGGTLALGSASSLDALIQSGGLLHFAVGGALGGPVAQSAGMIAVSSGSLLVDEGGSFAGALSGAGEITFAGGDVTLESGLVLSVGTLLVADTTTLAGDITDTGDFALASTGTLDLAGHDFIVNNSLIGANAEVSLSGLIEGTGTFSVEDTKGTVDGLATTGSIMIIDRGTLDVNGPVTLGTAATDHTTLFIPRELVLQQGATIAANGAALIRIGLHGIYGHGTLEDVAQSGTISVPASVDNFGRVELGRNLRHKLQSELLFSAGTFTNDGLVEARSGTIAFGPDVTVTNLVKGTLTGGVWAADSGTIALTGGPITTDAAAIYLGSGTAVIGADNGDSLTPIQQSLSTIASYSTLGLDNGQYVMKRNLVDDGVLYIRNSNDQFQALRVGRAGSVEVQTGTLTASSVRSDGAVILTHRAVFDAPFVSDGLLLMSRGSTLELAGANNFIGGSIASTGGTLVLESGSSTTIGAGARRRDIFNISPRVTLDGAALTFDRSLALAAQFDVDNGSTIDLNEHTLKLSRGTLSTVAGNSGPNVLVDGGGTLLAYNTMTLAGVTLTGGTELSNTRSISQTGAVTLGDVSGGTASFVNQAGATYTMAGAVAIDAASATADTITNAGTFEKTGTGTATIGAAFTNTGTIDVTSGTLEITAAFTNTGTIIGTETQSGGITTITPPSVALFNQYVAAELPTGGSESLALPPPVQRATPTLAAAHTT